MEIILSGPKSLRGESFEQLITTAITFDEVNFDNSEVKALIAT